MRVEAIVGDGTAGMKKDVQNTHLFQVDSNVHYGMLADFGGVHAVPSTGVHLPEHKERSSALVLSTAGCRIGASDIMTRCVLAIDGEKVRDVRKLILGVASAIESD
jgi:hypothetical protein